MNKLFNANKQNFLVYHKQIVDENKAPYVVFLHGMMSHMQGQKAISIGQHCQNRGYNFIKFDNYGCGESSGKFADQTISDWLDGVDLVLSNFAKGKVVIVGSSLGAWIALLAAQKWPKRISGIVSVANAADFTQEVIWASLSEADQTTMKIKGYLDIKGNNPNYNELYPISYKLIEDARKYLLLGDESCKLSGIECPVHLIHGMLDQDVSHTISLRVAKMLQTNQVVLKLIKDGDHRLCRPLDLKIINNSIDELIETIN